MEFVGPDDPPHPETMVVIANKAIKNETLSIFGVLS